MKAGGNLVFEFSTATFEVVRAGINGQSKKELHDYSRSQAKTDKENNIINELYRVSRRVKGHGFTINLFRTTSKMMVSGTGMKDFMEQILQAISASVKSRREEPDKPDTELEKALQHTSTMISAEQRQNIDSPVRLKARDKSDQYESPQT